MSRGEKCCPLPASKPKKTTEVKRFLLDREESDGEGKDEEQMVKGEQEKKEDREGGGRKKGEW